MKLDAKTCVAIVAVAVLGLFLLYVEPTFLIGQKVPIKILKVGKGVRIVAPNMLCIDYPQVGKLYYFATVRSSGTVTVRLVVGGGMYSMVSGTLKICNVETGKCRTFRGMMGIVEEGIYNISASCPVASATFCIEFTG